MTNINTNNNLPVLLQNFLTNSRITEKSENTISDYKTDLKMMFRFMKTIKTDTSNIEFKDIDISDIDLDFIKSITISEIDDFLGFLMTKEGSNSANSRRRKISSIKSFYTYLQKKKIITVYENIALEIEKPKLTKRTPVALTKEEGLQLINSVDVNDFNYERDLAIIVILLNCGLRREEISSLNIDSIKNGTLEIIGKGNKQRYIGLNDSVIKVINNWLEIRTEKEIDTNEKALFISQKNNRLSKESVGNIVKKYIIKIGLDPEVYSTHNLRHSCAMAMYENGEDPLILKALLGHASLNTTTIYVHANAEKVKNAVNNSPYNCLT